MSMIDTLLYYGYDPKCKNSRLSPEIELSLCSRSDTISHNNLTDEGISAFAKSIDMEINKIGEPSKHVVPISSGLDSRAILASLLKHSEVCNDMITTVSFGVPGTWDYEIGQMISEIAEVENITINLDKDSFDWSESSLRRYTRSLECPTRVFEGYVNSKICDGIKEPYVVWSGYLGDPSAGSHLPEDPAGTWSEACNQFSIYNQFAPTLVNESFDPTEPLPDEPYFSRDILTYEEQLDFVHRQQCFIRPLVIPDAGQYLTPFTQEPWLKFILNTPDKERSNRALFTKIMSEFAPDLFSYPSGTNYGLPPNAGKLRLAINHIRLKTSKIFKQITGNNYVDPAINYLDFESKIRENNELSKTIRDLVFDFGRRQNYNVSHIWERHQSGQNRANELRSIASAELYLTT